jgi:CBS domain-containing protein
MTLNELAQAAIRGIQTRDPVRVRADDVLIDVVRLMKEKRRGSVLVEGEDGKLVGIFTEQDLMTRVDHGSHSWHRIPVRDVMTRNPVCVKMDDMIAHALRWMHQGGFRRLTRVDADGRPAGIVSIRDILSYIAAHFPQEFLNLPPDPSREATRPWGG